LLQVRGQPSGKGSIGKGLHCYSIKGGEDWGKKSKPVRGKFKVKKKSERKTKKEGEWLGEKGSGNKGRTDSKKEKDAARRESQKVNRKKQLTKKKRQRGKRDSKKRRKRTPESGESSEDRVKVLGDGKKKGEFSAWRTRTRGNGKLSRGV